MAEVNKELNQETGRYMSFLEHLEELRSRLLISLGSIGAATLVAFFFSDQLLILLYQPLKDLLALHTSSFVETFTVCIKVSAVVGLFVSFPIIMYQMWRFISPGLYEKERKSLLPFIVSAWIFFIVGGLFAYFIMLPLALKMMVKFTPEGLQNTWFISKYISIVLTLIVACGILFDMPLVIVLLAKLGIVDPRTLAKYRGYALLLSFVLAAVMTPPDPITQLMLGAPLYILFELSIALSRLLGYGKKSNSRG